MNRKEGYLILSGGLTYHNLGDFTGFSESTAQPVHKEFHQAILDAVIQPKVSTIHDTPSQSNVLWYL